MKNILKSIATILAGAAIFAACQEEDNLATSISVDKTAVTFTAASPAAQTVNLTANGDWYVYAPEWLTITPSHGSGNAAVKILASANLDSYSETNAPRSETVVFWSSDDNSAIVEVSQEGENGLDATRNFTKITTAAEFDATKTSMIVFDIDGVLKALLPFKGASESAYSYLSVTEVEAVDNVITYPNGSLAYSFPTKDDGYALLQSNGYYLFGSGSYSSFYSTTNIATADKFSVSFDEAGHVLLANQSTGRTIHYSTTYGNVEEVGADFSILPYLYQDKAAASDEVLSVTEALTVIASADSAVFDVTANKNWTVRNHDSWIKSFTKSGSKDGKIVVKFDKNTSTEEAREATFTVIGETTNVTVTLTQSPIATTVAGILAQITSINSKAPSPYEAVFAENGPVVTYKNGSNIFLQDETGAILLYSSVAEAEAGKVLTGTISGTGYIYNGLPELASISGATWTAGGTIPCDTLTIKDLIDDFAANMCKRIYIKDVEVTDGLNGADRDGKIVDASGKDILLRSQYKTGILVPAGSKGGVVAFPIVYGTTNEIAIYENAQFELSLTGGAFSFAKNPLTLTVGETVSAGATVNSGAAITYSVAPADTVISVDASGNVTGLKAGSSVVYVSAPAVDGFTAASDSVVVTVTAGVDPFATTVTFALGEYSYSQEAKINGGTDKKTAIKIGTASKVGSFTITIPAGTNKITYYAVAWGTNPTTIEFKNGATLVSSQVIAGNSGATGNSPYTITVADSDKYTITQNFANETVLTVSTADGASKRAIFFGIQTSK